MYRPNFCAECGGQVLRARWHFWTSRRFCPDCSRRFRRERILLPLLLGASLFAVGLCAGRLARPAAPPLLLEHAGQPPAPPAPQPSKRDAAGRDEAKAAASPSSAEEVVSICGARTQKGMPCSRRVRGTGRCWQHLGMPAMIPLEKRLLTGKLPPHQGSEN